MKAMYLRLNLTIGALALGVASLVVLTVLNSQAGSETKNPPGPVPAPAWTLRDVDGKSVSSADFKAKWSFWIFGPRGAGHAAWKSPVSLNCKKLMATKDLPLWVCHWTKRADG